MSLARLATVLCLFPLAGCGSATPDVRHDRPRMWRQRLTLRAFDRDLKALMKVVPIGTPVVISA